MNTIPTDPISFIIWLINAGIITLTAGEAFDRLRRSIAATAQQEGRDVTPEEQALIKRLEDESDADRRGTNYEGPPE